MGFPILGAINTVIGGVSTVAGLTSNPQDAARKAEADSDFKLALNGDSGAEARLRCHAGQQQYLGAAIAAGLNAGSTEKCGYATTTARNYAAGLVAQLDARRTTATGAGVVAAGATGVGLGASPGAFAGSAGATALPFVLDSIPWGTLAIIGVGLYLALKGR